MVSVVWLYVAGIVVLLWLIFQRWRAYQSLQQIKQGCTSCRSLSVEDGVLTKEECEEVLKGKRLALKKLGKKVVVRKEVPLTGGFKALVFLNDGFVGGEVRSDDQIVYPVAGRKVTGKIRSHQVVGGSRDHREHLGGEHREQPVGRELREQSKDGDHREQPVGSELREQSKDSDRREQPMGSELREQVVALILE